MNTHFHGLQAALQAAVRTLDDRSEFTLSELIYEVQRHNVTLFDGLSGDERQAACAMTLDGVRIAEGALGWLQLDFVAATSGYRPEGESVGADMTRLAIAHPEVGDAKLPVLNAFSKWTGWYIEEQNRRLAEMERLRDLLQASGAPTLDAAFDQIADTVIERAKRAP